MISKMSLCFVVALFALSGCASHMSREECSGRDFYKMGLEDGKDGNNSDALTQAANECQALGVSVDNEKYNRGHEAGLAQYCSESRAKSDAKDGKATPICASIPPYMNKYNQTLDQMKKDKLDAINDIHQSQKDLDQKELKAQSDLKKLEEQKRETPSN